MCVRLKDFSSQFVSVCRTCGLAAKKSALREALSQALYKIPYAQARARENAGKLMPEPFDAAAQANFSDPAQYYRLDALSLTNALSSTCANFVATTPVRIFLEDLQGSAPLFHKYETEFDARQAFVEFDFESGEVIAGWEPDSSAPEYLYRGLARRFYISPLANTEALGNLLRSEKVQRILVHLSQHRVMDAENGGDAFYSLDDEGEAAAAELEDILSKFDKLDAEPQNARVLVFEDDLRNRKLSNVWPPKLSLDQADARLEQQVEKEGSRIYGDVARALLDRAEEEFLAEDGDAKISEEQMQALKDAGRIA